MYTVIGKAEKIHKTTGKMIIALLMEHDDDTRCRYAWLPDPEFATGEKVETTGFDRLEEALMVMRFQANASEYFVRMVVFFG